jgi:hypothetical protein
MYNQINLKRMKSTHIMGESNNEQELSDQLIINRFKPHLNPDESEFYYVLGSKKFPIWIQFVILLPLAFIFGIFGIFMLLLGLFLGTILLTKTYFIGLTSQRLLFMHISSGFKEKSLESIEISDIGGAKIEDKYRFKYLTIMLRTGKKYKVKIEKSLYTVKKQEENLEKICQILNVQ